ncbi:hypothetical protein F5887DRAFT_510951 [Amanita rubescens]|nr:hypothetical protein F5887DRAFT_510951 [Amanita rubescens]
MKRAPASAPNTFPGISNYRVARNSFDYRSASKTHFDELSSYLAVYLAEALPNSRTTARQKLARLTIEQFHELSTDVYDELMRRKNENEVSFLLVRKDFHPKRNQAWQKLSTLPTSRFKDLSGDVHFELSRRYPEFKENTDAMHRSLLINDVTVGPDFDTTTGDFGCVFRGQHKGRPVTLQLTYQVRREDVDVSALNADSSSNNFDTKNYYRDVLAWRSLCHRYILPPLGIFEVKSRFFLVLPLMINGTLTEWRKKQACTGYS